ncbi:MAG: FGGY-family carbohydrate kinase [Homoserinimonas sp.]
MAVEGLVVGVDIGTSSTKGVLSDLHGRILCTVVEDHTVDRPTPRQVEMDGNIWWKEFSRIANQLVSVAEAPILAVGVSGMGPCVLLTDDSGVPTRPAILYGVDTRAIEQIDRMTRELGSEQILERCGSALSSQAVGPKLAWVAENEPAVWARSRRLFMPASWLAWQLTGVYALDHHSASQCTPLYDTAAREWFEPWAGDIVGGLSLPQLKWPGDNAGTVSATAAAATGLPEGIPVIMGTIDAWSEAVSVGAQNPGDLMLMYGTTMFLISTASHRVRHPNLWGTVGAYRDTWNMAGGMATSGAITNWLRDLFGGEEFATLVAEAESSPAGSRGLLMLPYFAGERTPIADPDARGIIAGLTVEHRRGDLYRAALEATAFGIRHNIEQLRDAGAVIDRIVAVGGGTKSSLWPQIVSDVTGLVQHVPQVTIGASFGAAYLAAGLVSSPEISAWNPIVAEVTPNPNVAAIYDQLYADYLALYPQTTDIVHRLAALQVRSARAGPISSVEP